jgi:hypothetical protein
MQLLINIVIFLQLMDKGDGSYQPDQTYADVDKARKRRSSSDEANEKNFEINSGNRV